LTVSPFNGFDQAGHITHDGKAYTPPNRPSRERRLLLSHV
jgi:hypothetical protein